MPDKGLGAAEAAVASEDSSELTGFVEAVTADSVTVDGQVYTYGDGAQIDDGIMVGALVEVHFTINPDGARSISHLELAEPAEADNTSEQDDSDQNEGDQDDEGEAEDPEGGDDDTEETEGEEAGEREGEPFDEVIEDGGGRELVGAD
jgi:hypothetical protein